MAVEKKSAVKKVAKSKPAKVATKAKKAVVSKKVVATMTKAKPAVSKAKSVKAASKKPAAKVIGKITKPLTKSELYSAIADSVELSRKQVADMFETLSEVIAMHLKKDGPEKFVLPGMLKIVVKKVPAKPAREGKNPFTGEMMTFKAKPASKKVKVIALSSLKTMC